MRNLKKMNFAKRNIQKRMYTAKRHLVARLKDPKSQQKIGLGMMVFGLFTLAASQAGAFTAPAAGSFAYTVYDVAVTQILGGAIGFVAGVGDGRGAVHPGRRGPAQCRNPGHYPWHDVLTKTFQIKFWAPYQLERRRPHDLLPTATQIPLSAKMYLMICARNQRLRVQH